MKQAEVQVLLQMCYASSPKSGARILDSFVKRSGEVTTRRRRPLSAMAIAVRDAAKTLDRRPSMASVRNPSGLLGGDDNKALCVEVWQRGVVAHTFLGQVALDEDAVMVFATSKTKRLFPLERKPGTKKKQRFVQGQVELGFILPNLRGRNTSKARSFRRHTTPEPASFKAEVVAAGAAGGGGGGGGGFSGSGATAAAAAAAAAVAAVGPGGGSSGQSATNAGAASGGAGGAMLESKGKGAAVTYVPYLSGAYTGATARAAAAAGTATVTVIAAKSLNKKGNVYGVVYWNESRMGETPPSSGRDPYWGESSVVGSDTATAEKATFSLPLFHPAMQVSGAKQETNQKAGIGRRAWARRRGGGGGGGGAFIFASCSTTSLLLFLILFPCLLPLARPFLTTPSAYENWAV